MNAIDLSEMSESILTSSYVILITVRRNMISEKGLHEEINIFLKLIVYDHKSNGQTSFQFKIFLFK